MKTMIKLFSPGGPAIAILTVLSIILLIIVFNNNAEKTVLNYIAYLLSAYTLIAVCVRIPGFIRHIRNTVSRTAQSIHTGNEKLDRLLPNLTTYEKRSAVILNCSLVVNLVYAVFKLATGSYFRSFWMGALGIYYAVLAALRFSLLRSIGKNDDRQGRAAYRRTAWQLNFLTLVMSGVFVQMVIRNRAYSYPGVLIYAMATWAFYKIIAAVMNLVKRRRDENKALAAARCLSFAGALMSILALQTAMIAQFGKEGIDFAHTMNAIGGAVVTALLITLSAYMIVQSQPWKKGSH